MGKGNPKRIPPRSDIENTRTAARIEAAAKVYWETERSRQTNDDVAGYLEDLLLWENAPEWMRDLIRTRMTAALDAADKASAPLVSRLAEALREMVEADDEAWLHERNGDLDEEHRDPGQDDNECRECCEPWPCCVERAKSLLADFDAEPPKEEA